jgi:uncharacterized protein
MSLGTGLADWATGRPRLVVLGLVAVVGLLVVLAALPSLWPERFSMLHAVTVDTDPENMLSAEEPVRVFHEEMKHKLALYDMVVVGVVNETDPNGVFNPDSLRRIHELTQYAATLTGDAIGEADPRAGVIEADLIAPSTVDSIEPGGPGVVNFSWLMQEPPATVAEALAIRDRALRLPFLNGTLVSEDGKAVALYIPITSKDLSYKISSRLKQKIAAFEGADDFHITGLPVAEDTFGVEMFIQMAVSAPLAMVVIFLLMLLFFRKLVLVISPMIVALLSVMFTMGLLVVTGNTIHIMSSMIPIFIMPIAVLDSIHILSEFFDRYQETRDRRTTIRNVMHSLFTPMIYTSLTSAAGFASLALTPIPPVAVFGLFVAVGILFAWLATIVFIPAYVMLIPERSLQNFGVQHTAHGDAAHARTPLGRVLNAMGAFTYQRAKLVVAGALVVVVAAVYGITQIQINDNPIRWFEAKHPIRVADRVLNEHFGGTYMAYLALTPAVKGEESAQAYAAVLPERVREKVADLAPDYPAAAEHGATIAARAAEFAADAAGKADLLARVEDFVAQQESRAEGEAAHAWEEWLLFVDEERQRDEIFKDPEALAYIAALQDQLAATAVVGKSNSLADLVKTVHRELFEGEQEAYRVPATPRAVAQTLITFQSGHRPNDLWHFVTPDYRESSIWVQLRSGDNKDMSRVVAAIDTYTAQNPPPFDLAVEWFGLTYINVIWQEKMVVGMLEAFLGSFLVVFIMMAILYRSALWALLAMIPLTVTIGFIYGVIGLIGKDYDMPVAVLSSLTLGLAVDFAIHFLSRTRAMYRDCGSWAACYTRVFGEPARAITRNVLVISVGFLPLLAAPLVPYQTVGVFLATILLVSGLATLLLLAALIKLLEPLLFPKTVGYALTCQTGTCIVVATAFVLLVDVNLRQFFGVSWLHLAMASAIAIPVLAAGCWVFGRRYRCLDQTVTVQTHKELEA